jgi:acyl-CoA thioesterase
LTHLRPAAPATTARALAAGAGRSTASLELSDLWRGVDGIFGGHTFAVITDTVAAAIEGQSIAALMLCFAGSVRAGEASVQTAPVHVGRRTASLRFELMQGERLRAHGVTEHAVAGGELLHAGSLQVPDRARGRRLPVYRSELPCLDRLEVVFSDAPNLAGTTGAWVRFVEPPSAVGVNTTEGALVTLLDVMPPGLFAAHPRPLFVPTLSFTAHFGPTHDLAAEDWMFVTHATSWATTGSCVDESAVWDSTGRLRAHSRQVRSVRW